MMTRFVFSIADRLHVIRRNWFTILAIFPFWWFFAFLFYSVIVLLPTFYQLLFTLETEFQKIALPPQTQLGEYHASTNLSVGSTDVIGDYGTALDFDALGHYYDTELPRHGWQYLRQEITDQGYLLSRYYCKGNYVATIDYYPVGQKWNYELVLGWRGLAGCPFVKGGEGQFADISTLLFGLIGAVIWGTWSAMCGYAAWRLTREEFTKLMSRWGNPSAQYFGVRLLSSIVFPVCVFVILATGIALLKYIW